MVYVLVLEYFEDDECKTLFYGYYENENTANNIAEKIEKNKWFDIGSYFGDAPEEVEIFRAFVCEHTMNHEYEAEFFRKE